MATIKLVKKGAGMKAGPKAKAGDPAPASYVLLDSQDGTVTVQGVTQSGATVDLDAVATLAATSSDDTILSVDPPAGMKVAVHGLKAGHAELSLTATWNDGSLTLTITVPCDVGTTPDPVTGLVVTLGTPTVR